MRNLRNESGHSDLSSGNVRVKCPLAKWHLPLTVKDNSAYKGGVFSELLASETTVVQLGRENVTWHFHFQISLLDVMRP